jgi:hypothetical protein
MSIIALNNTEHKDLRINPRYVLKYMDGVQMVPVIVHECAYVGCDAPVVFVKNQETGQFQMVALYGLAPGENVFARNGDWMALSLPLVVQNMPLKLISDSDDSDRKTIGVEDTSPFIDGEEGEALFDANGEETEFLKSRKELLGQYYEGDRVTKAFVNLLSEMNLLAQRELKINADGEKIDIAGLYCVDEAKLGELSTDDFNKLRTSGFLPVVYAQLISMNQIRRLTRFRAKA